MYKLNIYYTILWFGSGNSFASTTAQVNFIASLVNASGWSTLSMKKQKEHATSISQGMKMQVQEPALPSQVSNDNSGSKGTKRQLQEASSSLPKRMKQNDTGDTSGSTSRKRSADPDECSRQPVLKRCRGKQPAGMSNGWLSQIVKIKTCKKGPGRPKGHSGPIDSSKPKIDRDGKSSCISIWKKMEIIQEYERLKKLGTIKKVEAFMLKNGKLRGGYQGCLSQSKWLGAREKYKWDEFIKHCPKLSQKVREVPNALLDVLGAGVPGQ